MTKKSAKPWFGKYRGTVADNLDPLGLCRITAQVPAVKEAYLSWALPCTPFAGPEVGFYAVPPIGANVWIEFEAGNLNYPIWTGGFWTQDASPSSTQPLTPSTKLLKTNGVSIALSDVPGDGGLSIQCTSPVVDTPISLTLDSNGLTFACGNTKAQLSPELITLVTAVIASTSAIEAMTATLSGELTVAGGITAAGGMIILGGATVDGAPVL